MNSGNSRVEDRATNAAQLRGQIDSGATGDKVAFLDPSAAPLGTDDEAGGAPMKPAAIALAAARETARTNPSVAPDHKGASWVWLMALAIVLVIAAAVAVLYWPAA